MNAADKLVLLFKNQKKKKANTTATDKHNKFNA